MKRHKKAAMIDALADALYSVLKDSEEFPSYRRAKVTFENTYASCLLERTNGNVTSAATLADKDRKDVYDLLRRAGVDPTWFRPGV